MDQVTRQFETAQLHFAQIAEKLKNGKFLQSEDFTKTLELLDSQKKTQETCMQKLAQAGLLSPENMNDMSLQQIDMFSRLEQEKKEREELRALVTAFTSIRTKDPAYQEPLAAEQARLSAQSEERLLELKQAGELQCYQDFLTCVQAPALQYDAVEPLAGKFGFQLSFALLGHQLVLPVPGTPGAEPAPAAGADAPAPSAAMSGAAALRKESPLPEQPSAREPRDSAQPAPEPQAESSQPFPLLTALSDLGELVSERKPKIPKSVKAFQRLASNPWDLRDLLFVANEVWGGPFSMELLARRASSKQVTNLSRCIDLLLKEGYLIKYSLSDAPEKRLYGATPEGLDIFSKEALRKYYKFRPSVRADALIADAADFLRRYECFRVFTMTCFDGIPYHAVCWQNRRGGFVEISAKEDAPPQCLLLPAAVYTAEDPLEQIEAWYADLREAAKRAAEGVRVFMAVRGGESFSRWDTFLREKIGLPSSAQIYIGTVGDDLYQDSAGHTISLPDYLRNLDLSPSGEKPSAKLDTIIPEPADAIDTARPDQLGETPEPAAPEATPSGSGTDSSVDLSNEPEAAPVDFSATPEPKSFADTGAVVQAHEDFAGNAHPNPAADLSEAGEITQQIDIQTLTVRENAQLLLRNPEQIAFDQLFSLAVQMIAQNRIAESAALLECLAESPQFGNQARQFYRTFQQCIQQPSHSYRFSSDEINDQQSRLIPMERPSGLTHFNSLYQTMVLTNLLWAMVFPSVAYDHSLYNNAEMVLGDELKNALGDVFPAVRHLVDLLKTTFKDLSFQYDGLGFSPSIISNLSNTGERERSRRSLSHKAEDLRRTPTSTVQITGLETCLKRMVGPSSEIGHALSVLAENRGENAPELRRHLQQCLGLEKLEITDSWLEAYINSFWNNLRRENPEIKLKRLDNDSPAQRVCKKALTDRLQVIIEWLTVSEADPEPNFQQYRDQYARIWNQLKRALRELDDTLRQNPQADCWRAACRNLLSLFAQRMQNALESVQTEDSVLFYQDLWRTPELIVDSSGEQIIVPELYDIPGLEPWVFCLYAAAAVHEAPREILPQISDYKNERWYRNFGMEALLCGLLGQETPNRGEDCRIAGDALKQEIQDFEGGVRMDRAYGRLQEHTMETVFSALQVVKEVYLKTDNYASFHIFLTHLHQLLDRQIGRQTQVYCSRVQALKQQPEYTGSPWLEVIEMALDGGYLNTVETYINSMQSGEADLPNSVKVRSSGKDFLSEFQAGEDAYYRVCQQHSGDALANWGSNALEKMDKSFQHWTSPNERANSLPWLRRWIKRKNSPDGPDQVKDILSGLGFHVQKVTRMTGTPQFGMHECYLVNAERVSTGLKDYPHPIYKFGTELSTPMNVVCLYGCQGVSTLIRVMTNDLQLNGSTIVLMDGSLTAADRRLLAQKFKTDTSGQSPFLLIDRVLALYLASVDRGERQIAMLRCTLPYTFEVLYGSGSGAVPEEMFIGRMMEMRDLRSEQGPSLVYGGRQLGKTALLNRVSKTLSNPARREYSFCVDVKDSGMPALLKAVSGKLIRLGLIQQASSSLEELCDTLQGIYEAGEIRSLRVFVDEVDCLFDEFQKDNYETLRPFITLRDNTKHKVKFVFAGTHNVAATDIAEKGNNNLLHMGKPLCIKPLSNNDAMDLIQIPMSYLGFEIGMPQIELILSNTNNYPGLIHMFCHALIQAVCRDYSQFCDENGNYPPYRISDAQMQAVFREQDIRKEIGQRVMATIRLNRKYKAVSYLLAQMVYEDQEKCRRQLYGYTARELKDYNQREFRLPLIAEIEEKDLNTLMEEMENMGILWKNQETQQFRFRQQDFLEYIGDSEEVLKTLLDLLEEDDKAV